MPIHIGASIGVAYVAAALALGTSFGLDFGLAESVPGPNLRRILREINPQEIPEDVREECLPSETGSSEVVQKGDWIAIWGGMSYSFLVIYLPSVLKLKGHSFSIHNDRIHSLAAC